MSLNLTEHYIQAFSNKDIDSIFKIMDESFVLEDPVVKRVEGKNNAIGYMKELFSSCDSLEFFSKNIFEAKTNEIIVEFVLKLDENVLEGVDILVWNKGKLVELRAYLDVPK